MRSMKKLRLELGLSQEAVARRSGLSLASVVRIESGQVSTPTPLNLRALTALFNRELRKRGLRPITAEALLAETEGIAKED